MAGRIRTEAIDGKIPGDVILVVDDGDQSYLIVKGKFDNIAVELDADGWHELAAFALQTSLYAEVPPSEREHGVVTALVRQGIRRQGMTVADTARRLGIDVAALRSVWDGDATIPADALGVWSTVLGLDPLQLSYAWQVDRNQRPDVPEMVMAYGVRRERRGRNRPRRIERVVR